MRRKEVQIRCKPEDRVEIQHLSSESRTIVWVSRPFDLVVTDPIVLIQGVIRDDGYLSLKILKNGEMVYPSKRAKSFPLRPGVSIFVRGIDLDSVSETFKCGDCETVKILDHRKRFAVRPEWRT